MRKWCGDGDASIPHAINRVNPCRFPSLGCSGGFKTERGLPNCNASGSRLVHEMPEGASGAARQPTRRDAGQDFRGSIQERGDSRRRIASSTCACIDLNPVAAGIVDVPEASPHMPRSPSAPEHVRRRIRTGNLKAAAKGSVPGSNAAKGLEDSLWLCPIEDRRRLDSSREGMIEGFSVGSYVLLIDYTGRLFRDSKAAISAEVAGILDRLGSSSARSWWSRIEKLSNGRLLGRFFAAHRQRLRDVARGLGVHHLANLGGCPAR